MAFPGFFCQSEDVNLYYLFVSDILEEEYIEDFGSKTRRKEATRKI
jgi:hypothetical protein